jgi:hypothetical protein
LGTHIRGPEERETYWQLSALVEIAEVQDDLDSPYVSCVVWCRSCKRFVLTSGMNPLKFCQKRRNSNLTTNSGTDTHPSMSPRRNRQMKNVVRPVSLACEAATILCFSQQNWTCKTLAIFHPPPADHLNSSKGRKISVDLQHTV